MKCVQVRGDDVIVNWRSNGGVDGIKNRTGSVAGFIALTGLEGGGDCWDPVLVRINLDSGICCRLFGGMRKNLFQSQVTGLDALV